MSDETISLYWDKWAEGVYEMETDGEETLKLMQQHDVEADSKSIVLTKKQSNKKFGGRTHDAIARFTDIARKVASARDQKQKKDC